MSLFLRWPIAIACFIIFALCLFYLMTRNRRLMSKISSVLSTVITVVGFLLYSYCFLANGTSIPIAVMRAIFNTLRIFGMAQDYATFEAAFGKEFLSTHVWVQILFWAFHFSVLFVLQFAFLSIFGKKVMDNIRLRWGAHREVYVIKGGDKFALRLGENIATHDNPRGQYDTNRLVVFLLGKEDDPKAITAKAAVFGGIVQVLEGSHSVLFYLKKTGMGEHGRGKKYHLILMPNNPVAPDNARHAVEYAKEKGVAPENLSIFVFVASEWDREKIEEITQTREDVKRKYPYTFHIIKENDLLIRQMIKNHPPYECPGLGFKNGVASRDFTIMILGFGTFGQSVLLHMVMNGQFAGSKMRAIVVDKNIEDIRSAFLHRYPGIELCCDVIAHEYDVQGEQFYKLLYEEKNVDYVVIALFNDEKNKQTARDIRLHYERNDIDALPIVAIMESNDGSKPIKDDRIFTFGRREAIYKDSIILRAEADRRAQAVNNVYMELYGGQPWHELDWALKESNRASADFIPAMLYLAGTTEDEAIKKGCIAEKDSALEDTLTQTEHLRWNAFHAVMGYRPISIEEMNRRFESYNGTGNSLDFARRDSRFRLQVCLAPWDELDAINKAYRELALRAKNEKEQKRDFKENDRDVIRNIPKFLSAAKG